MHTHTATHTHTHAHTHTHTHTHTGTNNDSLYVFDVNERKVVARVAGHDDDVNAVCVYACVTVCTFTYGA